MSSMRSHIDNRYQVYITRYLVHRYISSLRWYHRCAGIIDTLISSIHWSHRCIDIVDTLISLIHWWHRYIDIIDTLMSMMHLIKYIDKLISSMRRCIYNRHIVTRYIDTSMYWYHRYVDMINRLISSICWCNRYMVSICTGTLIDTFTCIYFV